MEKVKTIFGWTFIILIWVSVLLFGVWRIFEIAYVVVPLGFGIITGAIWFFGKAIKKVFTKKSKSTFPPFPV